MELLILLPDSGRLFHPPPTDASRAAVDRWWVRSERGKDGYRLYATTTPSRETASCAIAFFIYSWEIYCVSVLFFCFFTTGSLTPHEHLSFHGAQHPFGFLSRPGHLPERSPDGQLRYLFVFLFSWLNRWRRGEKKRKPLNPWSLSCSDFFYSTMGVPKSMGKRADVSHFDDDDG